MLVKEYFPVSIVVPAILEIYQNLLGVQFEPIQNASTWHPGMFVTFSITIPCSIMPFLYVKMSKRFPFGRKMLKMPLVSSDIATWICSLVVCKFIFINSLDWTQNRIEAKYSHAAVWPLLAGYELPNNTRHYPLAAVVANVAKPTPDKPALMRHEDVVTFFHEIGHVFHDLLSKTKYSRFHGTRLVFYSCSCLSQILH